MLSQACWRQRKLKCPARRQPVGQDREGLAARMTDSAAHPNAFVLFVVGLAESPSMADDRVVAANRTSPRQEVQAGSPRVDVVFRFWQCDKNNHGWREGPPVTVPCQSFRSAGRAFTLRLNQFRTKKEYCFPSGGRQPLTLNIGRYKRTWGASEVRMLTWLPVRSGCDPAFEGRRREEARDQSSLNPGIRRAQ